MCARLGDGLASGFSLVLLGRLEDAIRCWIVEGTMDFALVWFQNVLVSFLPRTITQSLHLVSMSIRLRRSLEILPICDSTHILRIMSKIFITYLCRGRLFLLTLKKRNYVPTSNAWVLVNRLKRSRWEYQLWNPLHREVHQHQEIPGQI